MKRIHSFAFGLLVLGAGASALAADWETMKRNPASVEVVNMKPVPLVESAGKDGWAKIPAQLAKYDAVVFMPTAPTDGVADFTVTADGFMLIACNYDYQGNSSGKWDEERWDEKKFRAKGWHLLTKNELGGVLIKGDNRDQVVFSKQVRKGDKVRLRCNKYDPPFVILLGTKKS